jgi:hypothetical protein
MKIVNRESTSRKYDGENTHMQKVTACRYGGLYGMVRSLRVVRHEPSEVPLTGGRVNNTAKGDRSG